MIKNLWWQCLIVITNRDIIYFTNQLILMVFYLPFLPINTIILYLKMQHLQRRNDGFMWLNHHIYSNSITLTHCHTTMEFLLAWFIANPTQQLCCRCSHTCICNCCLPALSGLPFLRRCSCLFFRMKLCLYYIYQLKISPASLTQIDLWLVATITQGILLIQKFWFNDIKVTVTIVMFTSFLLLMLVLSWSSLEGIFL